MTINGYLTFNGNCREAMNFYKKCLGGELTFQTIGDSPLSEKMNSKMQNAILTQYRISTHDIYFKESMHIT